MKYKKLIKLIVLITSTVELQSVEMQRDGFRLQRQQSIEGRRRNISESEKDEATGVRLFSVPSWGEPIWTGCGHALCDIESAFLSRVNIEKEEDWSVKEKKVRCSLMELVKKYHSINERLQMSKHNKEKKEECETEKNLWIRDFQDFKRCCNTLPKFDFLKKILCVTTLPSTASGAQDNKKKESRYFDFSDCQMDEKTGMKRFSFLAGGDPVWEGSGYSLSSIEGAISKKEGQLSVKERRIHYSLRELITQYQKINRQLQMSKHNTAEINKFETQKDEWIRQFDKFKRDCNALPQFDFLRSIICLGSLLVKTPSHENDEVKSPGFEEMNTLLWQGYGELLRSLKKDFLAMRDVDVVVTSMSSPLDVYQVVSRFEKLEEQYSGTSKTGRDQWIERFEEFKRDVSSLEKFKFMRTAVICAVSAR